MVSVLIATFEPVVLKPYATVWGLLLGPGPSRALWKVCKTLAPFWFLCYVSGASVFFYSLTLREEPEGDALLVITLIESCGVVSASKDRTSGGRGSPRCISMEIGLIILENIQK